MPNSYKVMHVDDFETLEGSGGATWRLARKSLNGEAFGFNVVDIEPGGELPVHDHNGDDQEEVYAILEGEGTLVADDEEHPAPPGTFARYAPTPKRTIRNKSGAPVRALLIGVPTGSGYQPMSWA